jgi:hypothetical protein
MRACFLPLGLFIHFGTVAVIETKGIFISIKLLTVYFVSFGGVKSYVFQNKDYDVNTFATCNILHMYNININFVFFI